jgi:chromosome segregation ATPase
MNMRILAIIVTISMLFASCDQREKELEQKVLELEQTNAQKDEDIDAFISSITEIQLNLDSIKELEGIVTARAINNQETPANAEDAIVEDMMLIYENMKKTRSQIETLEKKLDQSSIASDKLKNMLAKLKQDIKEKDEEITLLKQGLAEANIYIDKLMSSVDRLALENERRIKVIQEKNLELQKKEEEIQTGFWAVGNAKDLRERNIIDKEGAFLGLGGVKVISEDMNLDDLEKINILEVTEIAIDAKKAELVTPHPKDSYEFVEEGKKVTKLVIDDPDAFWQNSKVLVIVTN